MDDILNFAAEVEKFLYKRGIKAKHDPSINAYKDLALAVGLGLESVGAILSEESHAWAVKKSEKIKELFEQY